MSAAAAATCVLRNAEPASWFAASAEPALKPNHPNHRMPAPRTVSGRLWGWMESVPSPLRFPRSSAAARAAAADEMWTTVPPAKSSAPSLNSHPSGCQTQCARGLYTKIAHNTVNITYALNFIRSATAPVMSPTVMIANIPWYIAYTVSGIVGASGASWFDTPFKPR